MNIGTLKWENDIALIKLFHGKTLLYDNIHDDTICFPLNYPTKQPKPSNYKREYATVAGQGATKVRYNDGMKAGEGYSPSTEMKKLTMKVIGILDCKRIHKIFKIKYKRNLFLISLMENICAGGEKDEDSCTRVSRGPLMTLDRARASQAPRWAQIGVVSWGIEKCGTEQMPGDYTNIQCYTRWILDNLQ